MSNIKMIVTDMDGTLLNKEHKLSVKNKEAIINIQKKGVKFVLASGRPTYAMVNFAKELQMDIYGGYILSYNGAKIIDCKDFSEIYDVSLDKDILIELFNYAKLHNYSFLTYTFDSVGILNNNEYSQKEIDLTGMLYKKIDTIKDFNINNQPKCMIAEDPDLLITIEKDLKSKYEDKIYITRSQPYFLEMLSKKANKGLSIVKLSNILNIDIQNVIAAGDSYNDLSMLEKVGVPIAVENAVDDLKKIAKYIVKHHEDDAMADIIEKYVEE